MGDRLKIGLVQLSAGNDIDANIEAASALIRRAAAEGAQFVLTPENTGFMELSSRKIFELARPEQETPALAALSALAAELGVWLLIGSTAVRIGAVDGREKLANRSFLVSDRGEVVARYDKIHMFDVDLPGGESYRESKNYRPGDRVVVAETPWGGLGLSICYDLRFPYLYRRLAASGARILTVPSAFTRQTGEAHWHILLRARAIETGCFVLAPAQCGEHPGGRQTFGHSLAIGPWGEVLGDAGEAPGILICDLTLNEVDTARSRVPSLGHTVTLSDS